MFAAAESTDSTNNPRIHLLYADESEEGDEVNNREEDDDEEADQGETEEDEDAQAQTQAHVHPQTHTYVPPPIIHHYKDRSCSPHMGCAHTTDARIGGAGATAAGGMMTGMPYHHLMTSPPPIPATSPSPSNSPLPTHSPASMSSAGSNNKRKRSEQERRDRHNDTERKGRQKINSEITSLKELLPELQNSVSPKANVLQCAVENIKRLQTLCQQLVSTNVNLKDENKKLWVEVNRLRSATNPHDTLLCEILEQKLGQQDAGFPFPGPLAAPPVIPVSMISPHMLPQHDMGGLRSDLMMSHPPPVSGGMMSMPSVAPTRQMWCYTA